MIRIALRFDDASPTMLPNALPPRPAPLGAATELHDACQLAPMVLGDPLT
jgi:hypothetical protein